MRTLIRWLKGTFTASVVMMTSDLTDHTDASSFRCGFHAVHFNLEDADDEPVVLLFFDLQRALDHDFIRIIAHRFALRTVHDDRVLDLRRLPEAAGKQARHERELR